MKLRVFFIFFLLTLTLGETAAQTSVFPPELDRALSTAGNLRADYERLLRQYAEEDSEKYEAACFLIEAMQWHHAEGRITGLDNRLLDFCRQTDARYWKQIAGHSAEEQETDPLHRALRDSAKFSARRTMGQTFHEPEVEELDSADLQGSVPTL